MMRVVVMVLMCSTQMVHAEAPQVSLRPVLPVAADAQIVLIKPVARPASPKPQLRLASASQFRSLRPTLRPKNIEQKAMAERRAKRRGAVCGDVDIQGDVVGFVPGRVSGCGVKDAVKVRSVSGIGLTQGAVMNCTTAKALKTWVTDSVKPAFANQGGGLDRLKVAAHYACRTRNNKTGARISEHGKGRAIDISGFYLRDGSLVTVLKGWRAKGSARALARVHKGACGPFGTVLGPNADRFHQDHFHFDTAKYRSGPYCR
ncbi:MAG: extensin family protein [Paracoccaceae bacterium]